MAIHRGPWTGPGSSRRTCPGLPVSTAASSTEPDHPDPQSQSLSRSYGSNLPTSLTYIILSTRGCSPWRPAADMGTSWCESAVTSPGFSRSSRLLVDAERTSALFAWAKTHSPCETIQGPRRLMQKRQLFPELRPASPGRVALPRQIEDPNRFRYQVPEYGPDSLSASLRLEIRHKFFLCETPHIWSRLPLSLRIDWPVFNSCSHGTLLHIGPPGVSLEYLLLPPRSAPGAAPARFTPKSLTRHPRDLPTRRHVGAPKGPALCRRPGMSGAL